MPNTVGMSRTTRRAGLALAAAGLSTALVAPPSDAATRYTVRGAGFGHGVGMSQYGAYGFASKGWRYDDILAHYYSDTALGSAPAKTVRVLLQGSVGEARVTGARKAGATSLRPSATYRIRRASASQIDVLRANGKRVARISAPARIVGRGAGLTLLGSAGNGVTSGRYRGALEFRASGIFGVQAVNALALDDYVRGVISRESPASWPLEALKAQAVAARTYALTTSKGGNGFDQYPDTRSQVYGGVSAETSSTDQAVAETAGQTVTYGGKPVVTYFFSTSGGRTEDVEKSVLGMGGEALPWLRSVDDPYDTASPKHRWGPYKWSQATAEAKLGSWVKGSLKGVKVVERGSSPRIVAADVVGTGGRTRVTGADLRARLGLYDSWIYFTTIRTKASTARATVAHSGSTPEAQSARVTRRVLRGRVFPEAKGSRITVQRRSARRWRKVKAGRTRAGGRYAIRVARPGTYRVKFLVDAGPAVRVR